jgi:hypothetical protein
MGFASAEENSFLRHSARTLRWEDFRGEVPNPKPNLMNSKTSTAVRYTYRYRTLQRKNRIYLEVTEVKVFAVFDRNTSWVHGKVNQRLLDHEQGHFDNAQIAAHRAQKKFDELLSDNRKKIRVSGTSDLKVMNLREAELDKILLPFLRALNEEDIRYDQVTNHSRRLDAQADERKNHARLLKELATERTGQSPE